MSDLTELIKKFKAIRDAIPETMPAVATSVSMAGKALAERQIKEMGFGKKYSTTPVPAFFFYGKELNKRGVTYLEGLESKGSKGKKKIEDITEADLLDGETTWGDFRAAQGLQNKFVDLTYSGKMWASMFPRDVETTLFKYVAPLGSTNIEGQNKMNWNYERYGDFVYQSLQGDAEDILYNLAYDELTRLLDEKLKL